MLLSPYLSQSLRFIPVLIFFPGVSLLSLPYTAPLPHFVSCPHIFTIFLVLDFNCDLNLSRLDHSLISFSLVLFPSLKDHHLSSTLYCSSFLFSIFLYNSVIRFPCNLVFFQLLQTVFISL